MAGSEPQPDATAWQEFMNQMQWAAGQLYGTQLGGTSWGENFPPTGSTSEPNPFGGTPGTMDNWVYTDEKTRIGFTGEGTHDIWGNDVTIEVAPTSAKVTSEVTTDTRFQPNEQVLKIIVTDPATGSEAVYFVHDFNDAKVKINTPTPNQVTIGAGTETYVSKGKFKSDGPSGGGRQASVDPEVLEDGTLLYEVPVGTTIDFLPKGSGTAGENEIHEVWGKANISTMPSDELTVAQGMPGDTGGYTVTIKHRDGSSDTFYVHKGFDINLKAMPEHIAWGSGPMGAETGVPAPFNDHITINSSGGDTENSGIGPSEPRSVEGGVAIVDTEENPEFVTNYDVQGVDEIQVTAPGKVTIRPATFSDTFQVSKETDANGIEWIIVTASGKDSKGQAKTVKYKINASQVESVFIDANASTVNLPNELKSKVQVRGDNGGESASSPTAEALSNVNGITMSAAEIAQKAADNGMSLDIPPAVPTPTVWKFLCEIDPVLSSLCRDFLTGDKNTRKLIYAQLRNRAVETLASLYPHANVSAVPGSGSKDDNIMFAGTELDIIKDKYNDGKNSHSTEDPWNVFQTET
ncbi:MAG TPA: hypothetical protein DF383_00820 [Deltaproteobacteria bacterium]|nr:hypothetical protein [Deltaproteobacteria bacterium]